MKKGWVVVFIIMLLALLGLGGYVVYDKVLDDNDTKTKEECKIEPANEEKNIEQKEVEEKTTYTIENIKSLNSVLNRDSSRLEQAQTIANEVTNAINNSDWYYLAKLVGDNADMIIKSGMNNYKVTNCREIEDLNEVACDEMYNLTNKNEFQGGNLLVISFEEGGSISIGPNCTGL